MKHKLVHKISAICLCLVMAAGLLTGCGGSSSSSSGYEAHTEVEGVQFSIPSSFTASATSVSEISENGDFKSDVTYEFKNGTDTYLLFNMNSLVIIVRKGTDFGFIDTDDKQSCLKNSSILSVQLGLPQRVKKFDYEEESSDTAYRLIGTVKAEAVITRNVYGDFVGKVSSICVGNDEWTMFVGVPGTRYTRIADEQKKVIEAIAESFIPVTQTEDATTESVEEDDSTTTTSTTVQSGGSNAGHATSASSNSSSSNQGEIVVSEDSSNAVSTETVNAENSGVTKEQSSDNGSEEDVVAEESDTTSSESDSDPEAGINMSNQKEAAVDGDAKVSDIYSMLSVGDKGNAQVISDEAGEIITVAVTLNKVVTGQEAIDTIKEYCNSGEAGYSYEEPPTGTQWVLASYDVDYKGNSERPGVNSKLRGLNGDKLYVNGIGYSSRTYDMNYKASNGKNFMVYYAVPINCKEYALVFGDGSTENLYQAAYFHITQD